MRPDPNDMVLSPLKRVRAMAVTAFQFPFESSAAWRAILGSRNVARIIQARICMIPVGLAPSEAATDSPVGMSFFWKSHNGGEAGRDEAELGLPPGGGLRKGGGGGGGPIVGPG